MASMLQAFLRRNRDGAAKRSLDRGLGHLRPSHAAAAAPDKSAAEQQLRSGGHRGSDYEGEGGAGSTVAASGRGARCEGSADIGRDTEGAGSDLSESKSVVSGGSDVSRDRRGASGSGEDEQRAFDKFLAEEEHKTPRKNTGSQGRSAPGAGESAVLTSPGKRGRPPHAAQNRTAAQEWEHTPDSRPVVLFSTDNNKAAVLLSSPEKRQRTPWAHHQRDCAAARRPPKDVHALEPASAAGGCGALRVQADAPELVHASKINKDGAGSREAPGSQQPGAAARKQPAHSSESGRGAAHGRRGRGRGRGLQRSLEFAAAGSARIERFFQGDGARRQVEGTGASSSGDGHATGDWTALQRTPQSGGSDPYDSLAIARRPQQGKEEFVQQAGLCTTDCHVTPSQVAEETHMVDLTQSASPQARVALSTNAVSGDALPAIPGRADDDSCRFSTPKAAQKMPRLTGFPIPSTGPDIVIDLCTPPSSQRPPYS
jgi:hypothetical protein